MSLGPQTLWRCYMGGNRWSDPAPLSSWAGQGRTESMQTPDIICPGPHTHLCRAACPTPDRATTLPGAVRCLLSLASCSTIRAAIVLINKTHNASHICWGDTEIWMVTEALPVLCSSFHQGGGLGASSWQVRRNVSSLFLGFIVGSCTLSGSSPRRWVSLPSQWVAFIP